MYDEQEKCFGALLDVLENLHDKRGHHMGGLKKSHTPPVHHLAKVTRSTPVAFDGLEAQQRRQHNKSRDYSDDLDRQINSLNKAISGTRIATRSRKPAGTDLRKTLSNFNANLRKAMAAGELTCDEVCRLEAYRNRMLQRPMLGLI